MIGISKGYTLPCWDLKTTLEASLSEAAVSLPPFPPAESGKEIRALFLHINLQIVCWWLDRFFNSTSIIPSVPPKGTSLSPESSRDRNLHHPHYLSLPLPPDLLWTASACSLPSKVQARLWSQLKPGTSPSQQVTDEQHLITLDVLYLIGPPNLSINLLHQDGAPGP